MEQVIPNAIERLALDHLNARRVLNTLEREVETIAQYQTARPEVIAGVIGYFADNSPHHAIEDAIFMALKRRAPQKAAEVQKVLGEHALTSSKLAAFAETARLAQRDMDAHRHAFCHTARAFIAFERDHIRQEELRFFRYAIEYLTAQDWMKIEWGIREADSTAAERAEAPMLVLKSA